MLELPLFFSYLSPENVFSPPRSIMVGESAVLLSRFSGDLPVFGQHSESDQVGTSLCIEPDTPEPLSGTDFPGCLPLPEGSESVFVSIDGGDSNPQQTVMLLPVNPINTAIPESDGNTSVMPLSCDQEACVAWNYEGRVRVLDLSETTLPGESVSAEMKARKIWVVVQTVDQNGNIIYQWYDQDGHLHTISEWEFKRRLSMRFQSLLEFLYPEYFGPSFPAGGGWHQWQYWKVRRAADRPENTGQQRWPARQSRHPPNGKKVRSGATVNSVQKVGFTKYQPRHQNGRPQRPPTGRGIERTVENEIDTLLREFNLGYMQRIANKYNENYDGKKHRQFCSKIKNATKVRKKSLTDSEKLRFVPFMDHLSSVVYSFDGISLSTCINSLTASQLFYPPRSTRGKSAVSDDGDREVKEAQTALIRHFITAVKSQVQRQEGAPNGFDGQAISNLLWALAKLCGERTAQAGSGRPGQPGGDGAVAAGAGPSGRFHFSRGLQPAVGAGETGGERTAQAGSGRPGQPGGDGAVAAGAGPSGRFHFSRGLQPAVGAGETGGERTAQAGSGRPGQPGGDGAVAAGAGPSGTISLLKGSPACCGRWRNWWRADCSSWIRAAWPARR